ncbi:S41 family peptidase [Bdellovibrionota bacterium FG-1]
MMMRHSSLALSAWLFSFILVGTAQARPLQCADLPQLFDAYLRNHYAYHKLTDEIKTRTVEQFIKILDPSKTNFFEDDVKILRQSLGGAFTELQQGNCGAIEAANQRLIKRMKESLQFVDGLLGPNYKFNENTELVINPDLRNYAKTPQERDVYLTKMAHFQVSSYLLTDTKMDEAKRLLKKRNKLAVKRAEDRKNSEVLDFWAEAFSRALDPHSSYMSQDTLEDFQIQMQLSLEGIGASLTSEDGYTVIEELIPGGAADKSKQLKPKDKIIAVTQDGKQPVNVIDMDLRDVVKLIRGKKGTKVQLSILRQGDAAQTFKLALVRDKVDLKEQAAKLSFEVRKVDTKTYKLGVIDLPSFYGGGKGEGRSCYQDVKALLRQARDAKVDGLVLDLSRNGGGLLDQAVQIGGLFIKKGGIVATKSADGRVEILEDQDPETFYSGPLVVLTSRLSASASEILAGALKDYHRGVIIGGDHSFGKGTVQVLAPLPDNLGAMKVTTGMFFIPSGISTQHLGVASDVILPSILNSNEIGEKKLDYSLSQQKIDTFVSREADSDDPGQHWVPINAGLVKKIADKAAERVTASAKFAQVRKEVEESEHNKGVVRLAEIRKKVSEDKKSGKTKKDEKKKKLHEIDEDSPFLQESENILVDLVEAERATEGPRQAAR